MCCLLMAEGAAVCRGATSDKTAKQSTACTAAWLRPAHREELRHALLGLLEQVLQVQQDALAALPAVDEGGGNAGLAATTLHGTSPAHTARQSVH
jgi:hypothetical protein